jgi:hypothetical protein
MATGSTPKPPRADAAVEHSSAPAPKKPTAQPRYQLTQTSYINDTLLEPDREPMITDPETGEEKRRPLVITYLGRPGPHMVPMNDAARAMYAKYPPSDLNPIDKMTVVGPGAEVITPGHPTA